MIGSRITHATVAQNALANMQAAYARSGRATDQLTSGKKLQVPSDDPSALVNSLSMRADARAQAQYSRNAQDGLGWLTVADSALQGASNQVRVAYEALIQANNAGTRNPDSRQALAQKVRAARDELLSLANTSYLDRPVFGGSTVGTAAFSATPSADGSYAYLGDAGTVNRRLDDTTQVRVDTSGEAAFVAGGKSVFQVLSEVADNIENDPAALGDDITRVQGFAKQIVTTLADVGSRYNRVESLNQRAQDAQLSLQAAISDIEDVDIPKAMIEVRMADMAYQASLAATAKVIQPTLLDFLR